MSSEEMARMIREEEETYAEVRRLASEIAETVPPIYHHGDGVGGSVLVIILEAFLRNGLPAPQCARDYPINPALSTETPDRPPTYRKKKIPDSIRKAVYERDRYRCVACDTHLDLTVDHIIAEVLGGPTELANLQTMCRSHNSQKGKR